MSSKLNEQETIRIALEGNIGVGKSTLLRELVKILPDVTTFPEPVEAWTNDPTGTNFLDLYYQDQRRWGFTFQTVVMSTFVKRARVPVSTKFAVYERSSRSSHMFRNVMLQQNILTIGEESALTLLEAQMDCPKPDLYLYLKASPSYCLGRIMLRARPEERDVDMNVLEQLHQQHESWIACGSEPFVTIDARKSPEKIAQMVCEQLHLHFPNQ
jgi:deoxyadenosine/deoxycytidine kinase